MQKLYSGQQLEPQVLVGLGYFDTILKTVGAGAALTQRHIADEMQNRNNNASEGEVKSIDIREDLSSTRHCRSVFNLFPARGQRVFPTVGPSNKM